MIGATTTKENEFYLMTEYCEYGALDGYLKEKYKNKQFVNELVPIGDGNDAAEKQQLVWKVFSFFLIKQKYLKSFIILKNINYIRCYTSWPLFGQKVV